MILKTYLTGACVNTSISLTFFEWHHIKAPLDCVKGFQLHAVHLHSFRANHKKKKKLPSHSITLCFRNGKTCWICLIVMIQYSGIRKSEIPLNVLYQNRKKFFFFFFNYMNRFPGQPFFKKIKDLKRVIQHFEKELKYLKTFNFV